MVLATHRYALPTLAPAGLGKWGPVADHVGTKTTTECQEHYYATYIDHDGAPLPRASSELQHVRGRGCTVGSAMFGGFGHGRGAIATFCADYSTCWCATLYPI